MTAMNGAGTAMAVSAREAPRPSKAGPLPRWTEERTAELCRLLVAGGTYGTIAKQMGVTRDKVTSKARQLRASNDVRLANEPPRQTGPVAGESSREQVDALAEAMANGATSVAAAARAIGISQPRASQHWAHIRAGLGEQAR